jgi:hypothetical protein
MGTQLERELYSKGYKQTGEYSKYKEEMVERAAEIRKEKNVYARVIACGSHRVISRGRGTKWAGGGYSIMIKEKK